MRATRPRDIIDRYPTLGDPECSVLLILALTPTALANPAEVNEQVPDAAEAPIPAVEGSEQPERTTEEPSTPDTALEDEPGVYVGITGQGW